LTAEDKSLNRVISSIRIQVEHAISSIKRCRMVKDIFRNWADGLSDLAIEVACALHNWRLAFRFFDVV
jgi:hypothetical protein